MTVCRSCSAEIAEGARFCSSCGESLDISTGATVQRSATPRPPSSGSVDHGRFIPGTIFASRYRIVALLGKGGMGEVYRADDMKLSQSVALKLLPRELGGNEDRRSRLLSEVRIARQISNAHVCRVYDVGEIDGEHFITMEYVQGEDLASLLHRIGRLPKDKGIEVARQICAGLAAAHERGVLHRDLKPANVMIDERGRVRLTDFGLAAGIDDAGTNVAEGTPAYMAPEQLAGREVTARSDIYALGLVLYEIFTGKRAFSAGSVAELRELRAQKSITDPSRIVDDIDPAVERVILRCLEENPHDRPPSAVAVAAALPGGDPVAAAVAAGETPSPELLAAAGDNVGLKPSIAVPLLLVILVGAIVGAVLHGRLSLLWYVRPELPPDALELKARETLAAIGYRGTATGHGRGWEVVRDRLSYIAEHDQRVDRWEQLRHADTPSLLFWYREARRPLVWKDVQSQLVTPTEPPMTDAGMITLRLDPDGHLVKLEVVPDPTEKPNPNLIADFKPLLAATGLDVASLRPSEPRWLPHVFADTRAAWEGRFSTGDPLRIEAAALNGRAVWFEVTGPWTKPPATPQQPLTTKQKAATALALAAFGIFAIAGSAIVRRNIALGRGDRRGAARLALFVFSLGVVNSLLYTTYAASDEQANMVMKILAINLFFAAMTWLLYVALEPFVRRRWPHSLIAFGKVLSGRFRDPLVGRDILLGLAAGSLLTIAGSAIPLAATKFGVPLATPQDLAQGTLLPIPEFRQAFSSLIETSFWALFSAFANTFLLMVFRGVVRREWLAVGLLVAFFTSLAVLNTDSPVVVLVTQLIAWTLFLFVTMRFGMLAAVALLVARMVLNTAAITSLSAWDAYIVWLPVAYVALLGIVAFRTSLAGRPVFRHAFMEG